MTRKRFRLGALALLACCIGGMVGLQPASARAGNATAAQWQTQTSPVSLDLRAVACPSTTVCYASADGGAIIGTTSGGSRWTTQTSGTSFRLAALACTDEDTCYAVGNQGTILTTIDGGAQWVTHTQHVGDLLAISCPVAGTCYVTGTFVGLKTVDGGHTWTTLVRPVTPPLYGISCPSAEVCYAVGPVHVIEKTTDGGATWTEQSNPLASFTYQTILNGVTCSSTSQCVVIGQYGTIMTTGDGGTTWVLQAHQATAPYESLYGLACVSGGACYIAGTGGIRLFTGSGAGQRDWSTLNTPTSRPYLYGVSCAGHTCSAVGTAGLVITLSGGPTSPPPTHPSSLTLSSVALYHSVNGAYKPTASLRVGEAVLYVIYYTGGSGIPRGAVRFIRNGKPSVWVSLHAAHTVDGSPDLSALLAFPRSSAPGAYTAEFRATLGTTSVSRRVPFTLRPF